MKPNTPQDSAALALQIQKLTNSVEELTRQNQEMRLWLQQEEDRSKTNRDDDRDSQRRDKHRHLATPQEPSSNLLREMRKEMDELRSAVKEKTYRSLDHIVRRIDSPFTTAILECLMPSKFHLPQLELFDGLKDPLDHLNTFKMTLGLQQPPTRYYTALSQLPSKELQGSGS